MNFYVTFGQKYRHVKHPSGRSVHPDGYWKIEASDEEKARDYADAIFGEGMWAWIYPLHKFQFAFYPLGEIGSLTK